MDLPAVWADFVSAVDLLAELVRDFARRRGPLDEASRFSLEDECFLEGILSRVWQSWSRFCRSAVFNSCLGTVNNTGNSIAALPAASSEAHVSGAAIRAHKNTNPPYWGVPNSVLRYEPTWGDVDVLVKVLTPIIHEAA